MMRPKMNPVTKAERIDNTDGIKNIRVHNNKKFPGQIPSDEILESNLGESR
jgi:hypothetical protein